jgi:hypothetical protein
MSQTPPWYLQYPEVKHRRNWRSWPLIRQLRSLQWRRLRPLAAGRQEELSVIRYYWADFLESRRPDLRGRGLEIGETATLRHYGGPALTQTDAIDLTPHSPAVRIVADLARADGVPGEQYDCFLMQFTTNVIFDIRSALYHALRLLVPRWGAPRPISGAPIFILHRGWIWAPAHRSICTGFLPRSRSKTCCTRSG